MASIIEFVNTFVYSAWVNELDYGIALMVVAGCYVYVYVLRPKPSRAANPFDTSLVSRLPMSQQDWRYAVMVICIGLSYLVMRVLSVMQLL